MANRDNLEEYLDSQMREQQYETQQMAEKIRAQFEGTYSTLRAYTRVGVPSLKVRTPHCREPVDKYPDP